VRKKRFNVIASFGISTEPDMGCQVAGKKNSNANRRRKKMNHARSAISFMVVFALIMVFAGCGDPPWVERAAAKAAMRTAMAKGADKAATAEFTKAQSLWDKANAQIGEGKEADAKRSYIDAAVAFERATWVVMSGTERQTMISETSERLAALENKWKKIEVEAGKLEATKKAAWEADSKAFMEGVKACKEGLASDTVGVKARITSQLEPLFNKWEKAFRPIIPLRKHAATENK
jgi:hypothetical protein